MHSSVNSNQMMPCPEFMARSVRPSTASSTGPLASPPVSALKRAASAARVAGAVESK